MSRARTIADFNVYDAQASSTGFFDLPTGTTAQRPTAVEGMARYNSTLSRAEIYDGQGWSAIESPPTISSITYANSATAASPAGGETITVIGDRFDSNATISVGGSQVGSVTFNSQTSLSFVSPAKTAGSYTLEVTNPSGISGRSTLEYSANPNWANAVDTILVEVSQGQAVNITTNTASEGSDTISYSETTSVLTGSATGEMGLSLNANNGAITGTAPAVTANTTFTFTLRATDDENQTADRQFKIKVLANYFGSGSDGSLNT